MSLLFLYGLYMAYKGTLGFELNIEFFQLWALFSIADAMWWRALFK